MNRKTDRLITFNRKNILDAADKLFSENSVEKTTMDMLATEAGCSKPTLYGYFKNKDEVFFALVYNFLKELTQQV
ncbi:MAG: TetR/AcrR family transcriptional regulator, partial [Pseudoflavonifractor sp.]|nr:TetR/AcrR family transcriptional regulator [Pseudoflavonifractor sp.]